MKSGHEEENENLRAGLALDLSSMNSTLVSLLSPIALRLYTRRDGQPAVSRSAVTPLLTYTGYTCKVNRLTDKLENKVE